MFMVVLMAFVALAIDFGNVYAHRRHMQNAADAGALAGAHALCFGEPSSAWTQAYQYATTQNGAEGAQVIIESNVVTVTAMVTTNTYLAGIVGLRSVFVPATAAAACREAVCAGGLWPLALSKDRFEELACDTLFYVADGNSPDLDCTEYICQFEGEDVLGMEGRAWVDYADAASVQYPDDCPDPGCSEDELNCWIEQDSTAVIEVGECIRGDSTRPVDDESVEERADEDPVVSVPLFDSTGCGQPCPGGGDTYHVSRFACVTVEGWEDDDVELPPQSGPGENWEGNLIELSVNCDGDCETSSGCTEGDPTPSWGVRAVSLIQ